MLLAYTEDGEVIATLDYMIAKDAQGNAVGIVDFAAHEADGGALTDIFVVEKAVSSGTWPEWIGAKAHEFRVEVDPGFSRSTPRGSRPAYRISALVHKTSGLRRERAAIEARIAERIAQAGDSPADIRDIVGGPDRPLLLDEQGNTRPKVVPTRPNLPVMEIRQNSGSRPDVI